MDESLRCGLIFLLAILVPVTLLSVPLYLRHGVYADWRFPVVSSDIRLLEHGMSNVWCSSHRIASNISFNAYLFKSKPHHENASRTFWNLKYIPLKAEESEYWGFYLPHGAHLTVASCARYDGARVLILRGHQNIKKCAKIEDSDEEIDETGGLSDEEVSSFSSSEEKLEAECKPLVVNKTLTSTKACTAQNWYSKDILTYVVPHSDYYYIIYMSTNNIVQNDIYAKFIVRKVTYDLRWASDFCLNKTECVFPLTFASNEFVVLEIPDQHNWVADAVLSQCEPRTLMYFPFYFLIPISILFFAFRGKDGYTSRAKIVPY